MVRVQAWKAAERFRSGSETGFSVIELLISLGITATVLGAAVVMTGQVQQSFNAQADEASVQQEARFALDWITRDIRLAGNNPYAITVSACPGAGNVFRPIRRNPDADALQDDIRIHTDASPPNGVLGGVAGGCTEDNEDITIAHDAAAQVIRRRDNNTDPAPVAMTDRVITGLQFAYLDSNRVPTANDASVAYIQVTITARTPSINVHTGQAIPFTLTSEVRVRLR